MARTPIHPGEILADELTDIGISAARLARTQGVPAHRISQIIAGKRAISADTALRLSRYFRTSPDLWMNVQKTTTSTWPVSGSAMLSVTSRKGRRYPPGFFIEHKGNDRKGGLQTAHAW